MLGHSFVSIDGEINNFIYRSTDKGVLFRPELFSNNIQ